MNTEPIDKMSQWIDGYTLLVPSNIFKHIFRLDPKTFSHSVIRENYRTFINNIIKKSKDRLYYYGKHHAHKDSLTLLTRVVEYERTVYRDLVAFFKEFKNDLPISSYRHFNDFKRELERLEKVYERLR